MATLKVVLFTHNKLKNGEHPIYLRITQDRKSRYEKVGATCKESLWDKDLGLPSKKHPHYRELCVLIDKRKSDVNKLILHEEIEGKESSAEEIKRKIAKKKSSKITVFQYFDKVYEELMQQDKIKTAKTFRATKNSLMNYREGKDFFFSDINVNFLNRYEEFHLSKGWKLNSIFVLVRTFKTLINKAKMDEIVRADYDPFKDYSLKKFRGIVTKKRALESEEIKKIEALDLPLGSSIYNSRQYFMFSLYCRGMNFVDMADLKWKDIKNYEFEYIRNKTKKRFHVKLVDPAIEIIKYFKRQYFENIDAYVFPILKPSHQTAMSKENRKVKMLRTINNDLKEIAKLCGIDENLTMYVARHSFATILKMKGVQTSIISELLGHRSESTTQIYLDGFGKDALDEANKVLLDL